MSARTYLYNVVGKLAERIGVRTVSFEVTQRCNQDCAFCYNVWKCGNYPAGELSTRKATELIDRIIHGYRPYVLSFTGGEPLMRQDLPELIRHASRRTHCNLITNGTLLTESIARELVKSRVRVFEFTLLSAEREVHNRMVGREAFDEVIEAIATVRSLGGMVTTTFVATPENIGTWEETLELNAALGVSGILFNRFNIGGAGASDGARLTPGVKEISDALDIAEEGSKRFGISISCGVPVPPCIIDRRKYKNIHFSDCPIGTRRAYPAVDCLGNVRPCNHSPAVLGNLFEEEFSTMVARAAAEFGSNTAAECAGCEHLATCRGGCRAAAAICGHECGIDPFVTLAKGEEVAGCTRI